MCKSIAIALAGLLSACATTEPANRQAGPQNAVYLAGDGATQAQTVAYPGSSSAEDMPKPPGAPLRKLYWYFSGR